MRLISTLKRAKYIGAAMVLLLAAMPMSPIATWIAGSNKASAAGMPTSCEGLSSCTEVTSASEILALFTEQSANQFYNSNELNIILTGNVDFGSVSDPYFHGVKINLYLGDYTMEMGGTSLWFEDDSVLNIYGGSGSIHNAASWAPLYFYSGTDVTLYSGNIVNDGVGSVNSRVKAVEVKDEGSSFTMEGGTVSSDYFGVQLFDNAQFVMNGGTINAEVTGVSGNGTIDQSNPNYGEYAIVTINDGIINAGELGIYAPHAGGVTNINGGTINSGSTGVELRAGTLNISGGTITASSSASYSVTPNGNGSTTEGAAVAVSQHTTRQPITANITGGTFTGPVAFSQRDPQDGDPVNETTSITGGTFTATSANFHSVETEDVAKNLVNVSGGTFSDPEVALDNLEEGKVVYKVSDTKYVVDDAPVVKDVPRRVLVKVGVEKELSGLDDSAIQEYGTFTATNGASFVKPNKVTAAVTRISDAKISFEIYKNDNGSVVKDTSYDRTIKLHSYGYDKLGDLYATRNSSVHISPNVSLNENVDGYEIYTENRNIATVSEDGTTINTSRRATGSTNIVLRVYIRESSDKEYVEETIGTINVYSVRAESEILLPVGAELDLTDNAIARIGNPSVVTAKIVDGADYASVSGTTAADGKLSADAKGTATLKFYVSNEEVAQTTVKVYEKQNPQDILLKTPMSQGAGDIFKVIDLRDTNIRLQDYTLSRSNNLINIDNRTKIVSAQAQRAGDSVVTVRYNDSLGGTTGTFNVKISEFIDTSEDEGYDIAEGDTVRFRMSEAYNQNSVTCVIDNHACEEDTNFSITKRMSDGRYTVEATDVTGGEYTLKFTDKIGDTVIAEREVKVRVHEIEVKDEEDADVEELYIKKGETVTVTADEKNDFGEICKDVWHDATWRPYRPAHNEHECGIEIEGSSRNGISYTEDGDNKYTISANEAGEYTITFSDDVAEKTINVYVFDFEVNDLEYHVKTTETARNLINAINRYWADTENGPVRDYRGRRANDILITKVTSGSVSAEGEDYFFWPNRNADAGRYTVEFSALVNGKVVDTKNVTIYLYEMYHPTQTEFYGEMSNRRNRFTVDVGDRINRIVPGMAVITHKVIEGDATGITFGNNGLVRVTKPGKYVVKYTDKMNRGEGAVVGEYTATFVVYNLDANAPDSEIVDISSAETYSYEIDSSNTYGNVKVTINLTKDGETTEVFSKTLSYPGETEEEFEFTPTEEGEYNVRIENTSAAEHRFREVETGSFYVIASDFEFIMVKKGEPVEIEENSYWSTTSAYLDDSTRLAVEDGKKVTIDTTDMDLGVYSINMYHRFNRQQRESLKNARLVVYSVVSDKNTQELNPGEVTISTIEGLYEDTAAATQDLVLKMRARQIPMEQVLDFIIKMWNGTLTNEDIEELGCVDLFNEFKTTLGAKDNEWLNTLTGLNAVAMEGEDVSIEVKVKDINDTVTKEEKNAIENALAYYGVDYIDYYDVSVLLKVNDDEIGKLHKLNGKITVALAKTSDPASGYTRQYFVIRKHGDGKPIVLTEGVDFYIEDGVIYVISDEFSTYAVAYKDTLIPTPKAPDTGEKVASSLGATSVNLSVAVVAAMAMVTLAGAVVIAKRK